MARTLALQKKGVDPVGAPDFTLPVSILAQIIESLRVDIAAQSIPLLNVKLESVGDVTLNVSITGTPTVNIQTSGGANIVIDKLTQGAYTERQSTLANNGATAIMASQCLYYKRGKFFPRGCRGFIRSIEIYCDNADSVSHTFTIKISPMPGMGPVATFTLSVTAYSGAAWRAVTVRRFWNYDSLFIWVSSDSDAYGRLGFDTDAPSDYYQSTDEVSWTFGNYRYWFRVNLAGETVGDLPVSGTVNTIEVPSVSTGSSADLVNISPGATATLIDVKGAGCVDMVQLLETSGMYIDYYIYCDGNLVMLTPGLTSASVKIGNWLSNIGDKGLGHGVVVTKWDDTAHVYSLQINLPMHFQKSFRIAAKNSSTATTYSAAASAVYRLTS